MARLWTPEEESYHRERLTQLYIKDNKTIREVGKALGIADSTVFKRLERLGILPCPERKKNHLRKRIDVRIPNERSETLAEFFGVMLGDGHLSRFQTIVTLGTKELEYVNYVSNLFEVLFGVPGTIGIRRDGYRDVYLGSVDLVGWLHTEGLVSNKVRSQVGVPEWVLTHPAYMTGFVRGFFDTDGSIYRIRFGRQIEFTNRSLPLLHALQSMLLELGYTPSRVSGYNLYLTRKAEIDRFFREIRPANTKHMARYQLFRET